MKTIKKDIITEIVINKSKFICILTNIKNKIDVDEKLEYYKGIYKDATHYCSAYIIDGYMKCDDDGEPSGTAGMPILNVLKNNNLEHVLCIVIRYFGGVKLGAGGLVRSYSRSVSECVSNAEIVDLVDGYYIEICFNYDDTKIIDGYLKDISVKKEFNERVIYSFKIDSSRYEKVKDLIATKCQILKKEPILVTV